jgi:hypothetical protein
VEIKSSDPSVDADVPYELRKLDRIIKRDVFRFLSSDDPITELVIIDFQRGMNIEVEKIKNRFSEARIIYTDTELTRYVQFHQRSLIRLTGSLLRYVESPEHLNNPVGSEILSYHIYKTLQHLLEFIEKFYTKYYDPYAWIPYNFRVILVSEIRIDIDLISEKLTNLGISGSLIQLILKPLRDFLNEGYDGTYSDINYLNELRSRLKEYNGHDDLELARVLLQMNFNSEQFVAHWIAMFDGVKSSAETSVECIEKLYLYHKEICQVSIVTPMAFNPTHPALKESLLNWLDKELTFQKEKQKLLKDSEPDESVSGSDSDVAIKFDISIAQVAYMIHVLVALRIIQNENVAKLLRFLARIIRTTKKEVVSYEYFKGKFYKAEVGARSAILNLLQRMIDFIKSDGGKI